MKNSYNTFILFFSILFLVSCFRKEENLEYTGNFINNNGYLPLAPDNGWLYETWEANLADDGSYSYSGLPTNITNTISGLKYNQTKDQVTYSFNPYPVAFLGGLLGNFNTIKKIGEKYYREASIDLTGNSTDFSAGLKGTLFLDENAIVGDLLHSESNVYESNLLAPIKTKYTVKTYVTGKYDRLPAYLTNKKGIDDHLSEYTDIIKVTDSLIIDELVFGVNSLNVDIDLVSETSGIVDNNQIGSPEAKTNGSISIELFGGFAPISIPIDTGPGKPGSLELNTVVNDVTVCPTSAEIKVKEVIDVDFRIVANDIPVVIDNYYAKGVGKIKTVTNIEQINGVIQLDEFKDKPYVFNYLGRLIDEECAKDPATYLGVPGEARSSTALELKLNAILNGAFVSIPFSGGIKTDLIQNLRIHQIRKTLN